MMRSLFSGVSGLKNHQTRMDVIGNNIANVNTTGFKGSRVTFQDILSQNIAGAASAQGNKGGTNPKQIGLGMGMASVDTNFGDGSLQSTGKNTDLALSGNGFFILGDGANKIYTRSGAFEFDADGNYTVPGSGMLVQGWMADALGNINANGDTTGITIPKGQTMAASATTKAGYSKNLSAEATVKTTTKVVSTEVTKTLTRAWVDGADEEGTKTLADGTIQTITKVDDGTGAGTFNAVITRVSTSSATTKTPWVAADTEGVVTGAPIDGDETINGNLWTTSSVTTTTTKIAEATSVIAPVTVYDSEGVAHKITGTFTKSGDNEWTFSPGTKTDTGYDILPGTGEYTIKFNSDGTYLNATGTPVQFSPTQANGMSIAIDFSSLTQYSGDSTATLTERDGYAAGDLESVSIDSSGIITGKFSNGLTKSLAQVAIATFNNPAGLTKLGTNTYAESNNSGIVQISTSGNGGAGTITPSNLEMSNVDLSEEFSNMIITQRGFQANSKIITVSDEMLETLANLKR